MLQKLLFLTGLITWCNFAFAQTTNKDVVCSYIIKGNVLDENNQNTLAYATVFIVELERGEQSDSNGFFTFTNICPDIYTFRITHVGCQPRDTTISVKGNTDVQLFLDHEYQELIVTEIIGNKELGKELNIQESIQQLHFKDPSKDLGQILSNISGINILQSGTNIFKPIIHGLHSDRLLILQNQVKLSGQSWGAEHAPEIDAASAQSIHVIKGAGGIEYGTDALGGVIVIQQTIPDYRTDWTGQVSSSFNTNQSGFATHARISKGWVLPNDHKMSFQGGGTFKRNGDARAPKYVLSNTGIQENNAYGAFSYLRLFSNLHIQSQTFYNHYYRKSGILAASHIGNVEDLQNAIENQKPFIINDWTYKIQYPRQQTHHHTFKQQVELSAAWGKLQLQYDLQQDRRQEYDLRRNGRSEIPVLDLKLFTHHIATKFNRQIRQFAFHTGLEYYQKDNTNVPGTGFRPVVPDYQLYNVALWARNQWKHKKVSLESGFRYENHQLRVAAFNAQNELYKPRHNFHTFALMLTGDIQISKIVHFMSNIALASRAPNVSELYSAGVHQSAAAIEYGDASMYPERSFKWTNRIGLQWDSKAKLDITPYLHFINGYIYLEPQNEFETTIRGSFPVFRYQQVGAVGIAGIDADLVFYPIVNLLKLQAQYSFIRMTDLTDKKDLIGTPPNQLKLAAGLERSEWKKLSNLYAVLEWKYVGEQLYVSRTNDFLPPPGAYHLLSFDSHIEWKVRSKTMGAGLQITNITNNSYRDYLDRFRYFADLQGINLILKWNYNF